MKIAFEVLHLVSMYLYHTEIQILKRRDKDDENGEGQHKQQRRKGTCELMLFWEF